MSALGNISVENGRLRFDDIDADVRSCAVGFVKATRPDVPGLLTITHPGGSFSVNAFDSEVADIVRDIRQPLLDIDDGE